jgi:hypothetical protein
LWFLPYTKAFQHRNSNHIPPIGETKPKYNTTQQHNTTMVCMFESFRNAILFIGFGTGFIGFQDVFLAYERTISLSGMPPLPAMEADTQQGRLHHRGGEFQRPTIPTKDPKRKLVLEGR